MRTRKTTRIELEHNDDVVIVLGQGARLQVITHPHTLTFRRSTEGSGGGPAIDRTDIEIVADRVTMIRDGDPVIFTTPAAYGSTISAEEPENLQLTLERVTGPLDDRYAHPIVQKYTAGLPALHARATGTGAVDAGDEYGVVRCRKIERTT